MKRPSQMFYDVWRDSAIGACIHNPRKGVNKCMHKREIDARLGEMDGGGKGNEPGVYMASQARTQTTKGKEEYAKRDEP